MRSSLSTLLFLALPAHATPTPTAVALHARSVPTQGSTALGSTIPWQGRAHLMARLEQPFGSKLVDAWAVSALGNDGFVVSLGLPALDAAQQGTAPRGVAWLGAFEPHDRVHADLWPALQGTAAVGEIQVHAFGDVDLDAFATALGLFAPDAHCDSAGLCRLDAEAELLAHLAGWDPVAWIQPWGGAPIATLSGVAQALDVDIVRPPSGDPPSYPLSGAGVVAALVDPDCVDETHPDLAGRVLRSTDGTNACSHATQCGGVLGGNGTATQDVYADWDPYRWAGMAPEVEIAFYKTSASSAFTIGDQVADAVDSYGAQLGSFSFRQGTGGDYNSDAVSLDRLVYDGAGELGQSIPFFWATANEAAVEGYHSLADYASAKNMVAVGATNANDDSLADFSSMGPTADGRLKPDVMAPGCYDTLDVAVEVDRVRVLGAGVAAFDWSFDSDGDAEGWAPMHDLTSFEVTDGLLHTTVTGRDPYMHGPEVSAESSDLDTVALTFHAGTVTAGQIFWQNSGGGWAEERHLDFSMPGTGEPRTVELDVSDHAYWTGTFTQLRLDPAVLGVTVPDEGPTYVGSCGTSLAAPAVAGVAALMIDAWQRSKPDDPLPPPAVYKAALTATATDMVGEGSGTNPDLDAPTPSWEGPDYATGWGLVWAPGAVAAFDEHHPEAPRFRMGEVETDATAWSIEVELPSEGDELRVMLAWDDPPGEAMATSALQNDLDLIVIDPDGIARRPWVLDPDDPSAAAGTGVNSLDNLEGVSVFGAQAGTYTLEVTASRLVGDNQDFAVVAALDGEPITLPPAPVQDTGLDSPPPNDSGSDAQGDCGCASGATGGGWLALWGLWAWVGRRRTTEALATSPPLG